MELENFKNIKIYVEGFDKVFIKDFLILAYPNVNFTKSILEDLIIDIGGYKKLSFYTKDFKINEKGNIANLVLLDADYSDDLDINNGFKNKCNWLDNFKASEKVNFQYYLFPNHEADGDLELLLTSCINNQNNILLNCWADMEKCVEINNAERNYKTPSNKSKIYFYLECLRGDFSVRNKQSKVKDNERDFIELNINLKDKKWNLDLKNNIQLAKLTTFFNNNLLSN